MSKDMAHDEAYMLLRGVISKTEAGSLGQVE